MYAAVDKDGSGTICRRKPVRLAHIWAPNGGLIYLDPLETKELFPGLKWEDEPIEFDIVTKEGGALCG